MIVERARYRSTQVLNYLRNRGLPPADSAFVRTILPGPLATLFATQRPGDQAHAVRVCRALRAAGVTDEALLQAALLHDVGKNAGLPLATRIWIVLFKRVAPTLVERLTEAGVERHGEHIVLRPAHSWKQRVSRALAVSRFHPELGAVQAAAAGATPTVVALIRDHQRPVPSDPALAPLLRALQAVDDAH